MSCDGVLNIDGSLKVLVRSLHANRILDNGLIPQHLTVTIVLGFTFSFVFLCYYRITCSNGLFYIAFVENCLTVRYVIFFFFTFDIFQILLIIHVV